MACYSVEWRYSDKMTPITETKQNRPIRLDRTHRYTFYIGTGLDKEGKSLLDVEGRVTHAKEVIADTFGGYTLYRHEGGWSGPLALVEETGLTFQVITEEGKGIAEDVAGRLARIFDQSSVLWSADDTNAQFAQGVPLNARNGGVE